MVLAVAAAKPSQRDLLDGPVVRNRCVVVATRQRFNQAVRRYLRDETRLHLTSGDERGDEKDVRAVRAAVTAGIPEEPEEQGFDNGLAPALALAPLKRMLEHAHFSLSNVIPSVARLYDRDDSVHGFADAGPKLD